MATLKDLIVSTNRFKPILFRNAENIKVERLNISRNIGTRTVMFSAITRDLGDNKARTTQMQFITPKGTDVSEYVPSIARDRVQVRSSSPWYKFAFGYNNKRIGAQFGVLSKFTVKGTGRPVNPDNYPGLDKHLIALTEFLRLKKYIK